MRRMDTGADIIGGGSAASHRQVVPFAEVLVTLTKEQEIKLRWEASFWRSQHRQMLVRLAQSEAAHRVEMAQAAEQAAAREAALRSELEQAQGKIRDLQKRLFGRKSERSSGAEKNPAADHKSSRGRGQQPGAAGHGRNRENHLPTQIEVIDIDCPHCPDCGLGYVDFPGTEDSEVLEIEVKAYRRKICRRRYRRTCQCPGARGILTAPPPARLSVDCAWKVRSVDLGAPAAVEVLVRPADASPSAGLVRSPTDALGGNGDRRTACLGAAVRAA
jgi:transposase